MVRERIDILAVLHDRVSAPAKKINKALDELGKNNTDTSKRVDDLEKAQERLQRRNDHLTGSLDRVSTQYDKLIGKHVALRQKLDAITARQEKLQATVRGTNRHVGRQVTLMNRLSTAFQRAKGITQGYFTSLNMLQPLFTDMAAMFPILVAGARALGAGTIALTGNIARMAKGTAVVVPALASFVQYLSIGSMMAKALFGDIKKLNGQNRKLRESMDAIGAMYRGLGMVGLSGASGYKNNLLGRSLEKMAQNYQATITNVTRETGRSIAKIGIHFTKVFDNKKMLGYFKTMSKETTKAGEHFGKSLGNIMGGMLKIGTAAAPTLTKFANYFEKSTSRWIKNLDVGKMETSIAEAGDQMAKFWDGAKALGRGVKGIFKASEGLGSWMSGGMLEGLTNWADKVNSKEGQERLTKFFDDQKANLSAIGGVVGAAWQAFKDVDSNNFVSFMKTVEEGMPQLSNLLSNIDKYVVPPMTSLLDRLNKVDLDGAMQAVGLFVTVADKVVGAVISVAEALGKAGEKISGVEGSAGAITGGILTGGAFMAALHKLTGGLSTKGAGKAAKGAGKGLGWLGGLLFGAGSLWNNANPGTGGPGKKPKAPKGGGPMPKIPDTPKGGGRFKNFLSKMGKGAKGGVKGMGLGLLSMLAFDQLFGGGGGTGDAGASVSSDAISINAGTVYVNGNVAGGVAGGAGGGSDLLGLGAAGLLGAYFGKKSKTGSDSGGGFFAGFKNLFGGKGGAGGKKGFSLKNLKGIKGGGPLGFLAAMLFGDALTNAGDGMAAGRDGSAGGAIKATLGSGLSGGTTGAMAGGSFGGLWGAIAGAILGGGAGFGASTVQNANDMNRSGADKSAALKRSVNAGILTAGNGRGGIFNPLNWIMGAGASGVQSLIPQGWFNGGRNQGQRVAGPWANYQNGQVGQSAGRRGGGGSWGMPTPPPIAQTAPTGWASPLRAPQGQAPAPTIPSGTSTAASDLAKQLSNLPDISKLTGQITSAQGAATGLTTNVDGAISKVESLTSAIDAVPKTIDVMVNIDTASAQAAVESFISANSRRRITIALSTTGSSPLAPFNQALATGGEVGAGTTALVGERGAEGFLSKSGKFSMIGTNGPEVRHFNEPGFVIPNHIVKDRAYQDAMAGLAPLKAQARVGKPEPMMNESLTVGNVNVVIKGSVSENVDIERAIQRGIAKAERARKERL